MFQSNEQKLITQRLTLSKQHFSTSTPQLVTGKTCQPRRKGKQLMPSELNVRSRGWRTSSLHKSIDDGTNVAASTEPTVSKEKRLSVLTDATSNAPSLSPVQPCRIWNNKRSYTISATERFYGNRCWFGTRDSGNRCVTIATASFTWAFQGRFGRTQTFWLSCEVHTWFFFQFFFSIFLAYCLHVCCNHPIFLFIS